MVKGESLESRCERAVRELTPRGQRHVIRFWDELGRPERERLLADVEGIPWAVLDPIVATHVRRSPQRGMPQRIVPAPTYPADPRPDQLAGYEDARQRGRELLAAGKVAAFTVAGGQGTRLGFDGPKGAFPVTPVEGCTLFDLFAGMVEAARRRYDAAVPWYIMTSDANHDETVAYFNEHSYFGLAESDVSFVQQGMLPAFDFGGKLLLDQKQRLALAPDGHGGSLKALVRSGAIADMRRRGVSLISYFQVDNPLVKPFDPLFIGLHDSTRSEMSTKVTRKADDFEKVGNVCLGDGRLMVIEYSEVPGELATQRNADGSRTFDAGNLAIHMLDVDFVDRVVADEFSLPFRRAEKKVPYVDETGRRIEPDEPNGVKLEKFVFDALPLAKNALVLEVERAEEFSPVKNATGVDSPQTSKRDQIARACRWLESAGITVPRTGDGAPDVAVEIQPSFALDAEDVCSKRDQVLPLARGDNVVLS